MKFHTKTAKVLPIDKHSLNLSKNLIENDELVAFPTETVYGLGANATSDVAVKKIFEAKGRPCDNPLIVHVHEKYDISSLVYIDHDYVYKLQKAFLPGPLTMVYRSKGNVSSLVSCGLDTLAIRVPSNEGALKFLKTVNLPIAAPSANLSKHTSPVTANHVYNDLFDKIKLILDGGKSDRGIESTVLDVTSEVPRILRSGVITISMIKNVVGECIYADNKEGDKVRSPGVKYLHYKPRCETVLFDRNDYKKAQEFYDNLIKDGKTPYFLCDDVIFEKLSGNQLSLGKSGEEIASNLYCKLLEGEKIADYIIALSVNSGSDIDNGIMNRLSKACGNIIK
ncbi:MAG: threonylcarbamoyl-AMP synthase [Clostridia bacterium]|nr:threonylcarbamoyl-AMP synthase [Clostridia bacterium]